MAAKVNTKFVVLLAVVSTIVFIGVAVAGIYALRKTGDDLNALGDKLVAEGSLEKAAEAYSKAVNKDPSNAAFLQDWMDTLRKLAPAQEAVYLDNFRRLMMASRGMANAKRDDPAGWEEYLTLMMGQIRNSAGSLADWELLLRESDAAMRNFDSDAAKKARVQRFRGIAYVEIMMRDLDSESDDEGRAQAKKDLEEVLAAMPGDGEVAMALVQWHDARARRERGDRNTTEAEALEKAGEAIVDSFAAAHGPAAEVLFAGLQMKLRVAQAALGANAKATGVIKSSGADIKRVIDAAMAEKPEELGRAFVERLAQYAMIADPEGGYALATALADHALKGRPGDPVLLFSRARVEEMGGKSAGAVDRYQTVIDLATPPTSLEGAILPGIKTEAMFGQVNALLGIWENEEDEAKKAPLLARAKEYRDKVAARVGAATNDLLLVDGRLKLASKDSSGAKRDLAAYLAQQGNTDIAALNLLANVLMIEGNLGAAADQYERIIDLQGNDVTTMMRLAACRSRLGDFKKAYELAQQVLLLEPDNKDATELAKTTKAIIDGTGSDDPVIKALRTAEEELKKAEPDVNAAIKTLTDAIEEHREKNDGKSDVRLHAALARLYMLNNNKDAAVQTVEAAKIEFPDDSMITRMHEELTANDPVDLQIKRIDAADMPEVQKWLAKSQVFDRAGRTDEAEAAFQKARELDPENIFVLQVDFERAMQKKDWADADRIIGIVGKGNLDGSNGLAFAARKAASQGDWPKAAETMKAAVDLDSLSPTKWRLLGQYYWGGERYGDAIEAVKRSLQINPKDNESIKTYLRYLVSLGQRQDALEFARSSLQYAANDDTFSEMWISLESSVGDRRKAIDRRRRMRAQNQANDENNFDLASLLISERQFKDAKVIIDELRTRQDSAPIIALAARWHAEQNDMDSARKVFRDWIDGQPADKRGADPYVAMAVFLAGRNLPLDAMQVMEEARQYQDPVTMNVDRQIGDIFFNSRMYDKALEAYERVKAQSKADDGRAVAKRVVECRLRMAQWKQADELIVAEGEFATNDLQLLILGSEAAIGQGDRSRARQLLDRAVQQFPGNYLVFFKRAEFLLNDPKFAADAEPDLQQCIRLNPAYEPAYLSLAELYYRQNKVEPAREQLRVALTANPTNDFVRARLVNELILSKRTGEALELAQRALRDRPGELVRIAMVADVYNAMGDYEKAAKTYLDGWVYRKDTLIVREYVNCLLKSPKSNLREAKAFLESSEVPVTDNPPLLLSRARVYKAMNLAAELNADIKSAWAKIDPTRTAEVASFVRDLNAIFPGSADVSKRMTELLAGKAPTPQISVVLARTKAFDAGDTAAAEEGVAELTKLADTLEDKDAKVLAIKALSNVLYVKKDTKAAADWFRKGLEVSPDDWELNNNLAYALGVDLNQPKDAEAFAMRAVQLNPSEPNVLDTLGTIYLKLNEPARAEAVLTQALAASITPRQKLPVFMHQAEAKLLNKDNVEFERLLALAEQALGETDIPQAEKQKYEDEIAQLRRRAR